MAALKLLIKWGEVTLNIFHNPSQTMTNLNIELIQKTELQTCLPAAVVATDFEQAFHRRKLETIVGRRFELH